MRCSECDAPLTGKQARFCSGVCRYRHRDRNRSWKRQMTCAGCGTAIYRGSQSLPQGQATCRACRNARRPEWAEYDYRSPCADCSSTCWGERCRPCADALRSRGSRTPEQVRIQRRALQARRAARLKAAPGLNAQERRDLLATWQRRGDCCAYCPGPAESVDHVVPLALGGTNYEGNLAPACLPCNARKNDSLLIEWRAKRLVAA